MARVPPSVDEMMPFTGICRQSRQRSGFQNLSVAIGDKHYIVVILHGASTPFLGRSLERRSLHESSLRPSALRKSIEFAGVIR
jgi:hypothetical protein